MKRLVCCLITSAIILISSFTNATTVNAFEKITNYEKLYSDSFNVSSTNVNWKKQGSTSIWIGTTTVQQSWTPQITFNKNITVEKGDILVFNFTTVLRQTTPDECSVGLSYWAVVDCYNEYESTTIDSQDKLDYLICTQFGSASPSGDKWCEKWLAQYYNDNNSGTIMRNKFFYTLRWQGETTTINNIRLGGVLFSKDSADGLPVIWSVGTLSFFRGGKGLTDIYNYLEQNDVNQGQQEAGQQAQQQGDTAGNQAQTDANQNTATMFQTVGNILGAITDTPAGDCTIAGNMGNIDLGNLNFCQAEIEPIRPVIRAIIYLVMALATYKIMLWVIAGISGLINWVQTGSEGKENG